MDLGEVNPPRTTGKELFHTSAGGARLRAICGGDLDALEALTDPSAWEEALEIIEAAYKDLQDDEGSVAFLCGADPEMLWLSRDLPAVHVAAARGHDFLLRAIVAHRPAAMSPAECLDGMRASYILLHRAGNMLRGHVLHSLAYANALGMVRHLLDTWDVPLETTDQQGRTALLFAVLGGASEVFDELISRGANVHVTTRRGESLIHYAVMAGDMEMMERLMGDPYCLDVGMENCIGSRAIHYAGQYGRENIFEFLCSNPDIDQNAHSVTKRGDLPIHFAVCSSLCAWVDKLVFDYGSPLDVRNGSGMLPILLAAKFGRVDMWRHLRNVYGADITVRDFNNNDAFLCAAYNGCIEILEELWEEGRADVSVTDMDGDNPFLVAAWRGKVPALKWIVDRFGPTVFEAVNGTGANAVLRAAVANRVDALRYLLQHISAAESVSTQGYTPLHVAAMRGHVDVIRLLIDEHGLSPSARDVGGETPLLRAVLGNQAAAVDLLVNTYGADVNVTDNNGDNALCFATERDNDDLLIALVEEYGLDVAITNSEGLGLLNHALACESMDVADVLVKHFGVPFEVDEAHVPPIGSEWRGRYEALVAWVENKRLMDTMGGYWAVIQALVGGAGDAVLA